MGSGLGLKFRGARVSARGITRCFCAFRQSEKGGLTALSLFFFLMMVLIAGVTLDMMRHESIRTRFQSTSDRAVLAAADLDQTTQAEAVVRDYIEKAGLNDYVKDVTITPAINSRSVEASLTYDMPTWFMNMVGIDTVTVNTASRAVESVPNVEIALVLDISGSMGDPSANPEKTKIAAVRDAAEDFVTFMLAGNTDDLLDGSGVTSISIVPYNHTVNIDAQLLSYFTVEDHHDASKCLRFDALQMASVPMDLSQTYDKLGHFDRNTSGLWEVAGFPTLRRPWCPASDYGAVLPHSVSQADLVGRIRSLGSQGNTAIDLGVKWGAMMLDPGTRATINSMIDTGPLDQRLNEGVRNRPADYADAETFKVMVLMTDGKNTTQYDLKEPFKGTMSPVFQDPDTGAYSVFFGTEDAYWIPALDADGNVDVSGGEWRSDPIGGNEAIQIAHRTMFGRFSVRFASEYFFRTDVDDSNDDVRALRLAYRSAVEDFTRSEAADTNARTLCNALQNPARGVKMYTIGFEVPVGGRAETLMQDCASLDGDYFVADGDSIGGVFDAIADKIQQLRLTH